jgi:hypothetical protein
MSFISDDGITCTMADETIQQFTISRDFRIMCFALLPNVVSGLGSHYTALIWCIAFYM